MRRQGKKQILGYSFRRGMTLSTLKEHLIILQDTIGRIGILAKNQLSIKHQSTSPSSRERHSMSILKEFRVVLDNKLNLKVVVSKSWHLQELLKQDLDHHKVVDLVVEWVWAQEVEWEEAACNNLIFSNPNQNKTLI
jgi:hypothetical protein